ncbi:(2Fe-2S)-binding protein [Agromyces sp. CFH 90414]|uniref:(2Fe-2S)-binding protein n=1 Tax=Agromyces agglutinans TaxID=2662258 RepID=A0A6I2F1H1_9MICO|nr:(2Fe-2S)-binding protein [Agromyces agglutinans]MRG59325.1 (2Fe-2S)-binding protein [Agromyces agglutinans]
MSARMLPAGSDPIRPGPTAPVTIHVDGEPVTGAAGQTIAGIVLANGRLAWRRTSSDGRPRGLFCGIGVCFDCIVTVNGDRDVRACQRRACDGDVVSSQHDELPEVHR